MLALEDTTTIHTIACIDIGSNSVHLVVANVDDRGQMEIIDADKITLRLASYLDKKNYLSDAGIEACVESVKKLVNIARHHTSVVRCVATYTVRTARNSNILIEEVRRTSQLDIEVVNGREEAWLEFLGAQKALKIESLNTMLVDIGGGSTEITYYDSTKKKISFAQSFSIGAVTLTKKYFPNEELLESSTDKLEQRVQSQLTGKIDIPFKKINLAVASSGTAKAIAKIISKEFHGNANITNFNGYTFTADELEKLYLKLYKCATVTEINEKFPIDEKRSEIILAGVCILREIGYQLDISEWKISVFSLREGLVVDTFNRMYAKNRKNYTQTRLQSIRGLANRFRLLPEKGRMILDQAMTIYKELSKDPAIKRFEKIADEETLLQAACYLSEVGKSVNYSKYHRHSAYIIRSCDIIGFTQHELLVIASIVQFHRKSIISIKKVSEFPLLIPIVERLKFLSLCLRLSAALNRTWRQEIKILNLKSTKDALTFTFPGSYREEFDVELFKLSSESSATHLSIGKEIVIKFADS